MVARQDLPAGTAIAKDDLLFMRADELGLPPDQAHRLIGRKTKNEISAYHIVQESDVT